MLTRESSQVSVSGSILGHRVRRKEDPTLLTRGGTYVADLNLPDACHAVFVRSISAHAHLRSIDTTEARRAPGVLGVFLATDLGLAPVHGSAAVHDDFLRPPLATDTVRFVGEPIAVVVAATFAQASDAAETIVVEYERLVPLVRAEDALSASALPIFPHRNDNIAITVVDPTEDVLDDAEIVVRGRYVNQRIAPVPIEPNSAAAMSTADGRLTLYCSVQMPHAVQRQLAAGLGMQLSDVRVIAPDVGGGFGAKAGLIHEHYVLATLARRLQRPVTWTETRSENMVAMVHSRAQIQYVELGLRRDGRFTGMRVRLVGDGGAYPTIGAMLPAGTRRMAGGPYRLPRLRFDVAVAVTNTAPTGAFRGAGRPEASSLLERVVDQAARELGIDPLEIRRRNFIAPDEFPFATLTGHSYDSGEYAGALERAAHLASYEALRLEQARRLTEGATKVLGIGVASYVEVTAGANRSEYASLEVHPDGSATVIAGTSAHGQGHETAYAMLVSDQTGIPVERIRLVQSDTDLVRSGGGTGGSRSIQIGGSAVSNATRGVIELARQLAAVLLEADVNDVVVDPATASVSVVGVPATALDWATLAIAARDRDGRLAAETDFEQSGPTFPFGTHISVVEVDLETGATTILRHVAVDDAGTVINPLLFEGQQHGGILAGAAQALFEEILYDADGNPITTTLAEYAIPSAAEMITFEVDHTVTPTPRNPLGAKGIGEASTVGSTPAIQNAVIDALAHLGIRHIDMPCTPERVWAAIQDASKSVLSESWREPPEVFDRLTAAAPAVNETALEAAEGA